MEGDVFLGRKRSILGRVEREVLVRGTGDKIGDEMSAVEVGCRLEDEGIILGFKEGWGMLVVKLEWFWIKDKRLILKWKIKITMMRISIPIIIEAEFA